MIGAGAASDTGLPAKTGQKIPVALDSADVVFPVLHGPYGEDGTIQGMLELAGVPYVGSGVLASAVGMDKLTMKKIFAYHGLPQVEWLGLTRKDWEEDGDGWVRHVETPSDFRASSSPRTSAPASASARPRTLWS